VFKRSDHGGKPRNQSQGNYYAQEVGEGNRENPRRAEKGGSGGTIKERNSYFFNPPDKGKGERVFSSHEGRMIRGTRERVEPRHLPPDRKEKGEARD